MYLQEEKNGFKKRIYNNSIQYLVILNGRKQYMNQINVYHLASKKMLENVELKNNRLKICYRCPLYSKMLGGICNNRLWLNVKSGEVSTKKKEGFNRGCGCILESKARLSDATCPNGKW